VKTIRSRITIREMVFTALFAAVLCVVAPFSLGVPVPLSFATLVIYIAAGSLSWKCGVLSVVLYVMLGAVGLPVFSNFRGGFHMVAGLTGGYIIGYIPLALATGVITEMFEKKIWAHVFAMVIGTILLYTIGTAWFMLQSGNSLAVSLALCVTPFLIGDVLKIAVASVTAPKLRNALDALDRVSG